ncbi:prepilin-type N-terminal cleavage/methylation domain-containing protein [Lampropedia puyangensis]|nr:prepilin-type N-terminal cleavage/methylation domain-containing protein [Lampropedia puyangensis]
MTTHIAPTQSTPSFKGQSSPASRSQKGLSLVEVMVAMAIGLFIVLLVSLVYIEGARNLSFRQGQSENLANSRYTLGSLEQHFSKAGYRRDPTLSMEKAFPALIDDTTDCAFARGEAINIKTDGALCIRFQPRDAIETDCSGNTDPSVSSLMPYEAPTTSTVGNGVFVERFSISNHTLVCAAQSTETALAAGVQDIHFQYGTGPKVSSMAIRKISAFTTDTPSSNQVIRALKYSILLAASSSRLTGGMESTVCDRWKTVAGADNASCSADSGALYQVASGAVTLRNLMP